MTEMIEIPKECCKLIMSVFRKYKNKEALTPSTEDSIATVEEWLRIEMLKSQNLIYQIGDEVIARKFIYGYKNATIKDIKEWNGVIAYLCDFEIIPNSKHDSEEFSSWIESKDIKGKKDCDV